MEINSLEDKVCLFAFGPLINASDERALVTGCYAEGSGVKALQGNTFWHASWMTPQFCQNGCNEMGYDLSGVENGNTCYCSNNFTGGQWLPDSQCNKPCTGNATATCGGQTTIEVYNTSVATRSFQNAQREHSLGYIGCWVDATPGTAMNSYTYSSTTMTPAVCQQACAGFKYGLAGLENGQKCFCGNTMPTSARAPSAYCNIKCGGNSTENCGGGFNMDMFNASIASAGVAPAGTPSGWKGCYTDSGTAKVMNDYSFSHPQMTNDMCRTGCASLNYTLAGNELGTWCYCGNALSTTSLLPSSSCDTLCPGNNQQHCGGNYKMTLFDVSDVVVPRTPPGWKACYTADLNGVKGLSGYKYQSPSVTSQTCRAACKGQGFALSGTYTGDRNSSEFCGSPVAMDVSTTAGYTAAVSTGAESGFQGCFSDPATMQTFYYTSTLVSPNLCAEACSLKGYTLSGVSQGSVTDKTCGSASAVAVYKVADQMAYLKGINTLWNSTTGALGYLGCYTEGYNNVLTLPTYGFYASLMSTETCLKLAQAQGYKYAGTENAGSCYAANEVNWNNGGAVKRLDSDCNSKCLGNVNQFCGGGGKLMLYDVPRSKVVYSTPDGVTGYIGCFAPGTMVSAPDFMTNAGGMSGTVCRATCSKMGAPYAALTGNNCFCSKSKTYGAVQPVEACSWKCSGKLLMGKNLILRKLRPYSSAGNATEFCGGGTPISVYASSGIKPASLSANADTGGGIAANANMNPILQLSQTKRRYLGLSRPERYLRAPRQFLLPE
ncbi:hypothetical protein QFC21_002582 [Naganishia friedmannii]|uniref:Uncharacterized protein n=1 Tax=Naganishia friedmannii TaxID=89922 RepID=A0ACC2VVM5_9TREE|nr:hypothetical protein QFC21_002582 [Naganishia friedmannii]